MTVMLSKEELKTLMKESAREGAREALAEVGLDDEHAGHDIANLRELLSSWKLVKNTAIQTAVKIITVFILGAITYALTFGK